MVRLKKIELIGGQVVRDSIMYRVAVDGQILVDQLWYTPVAAWVESPPLDVAVLLWQGDIKGTTATITSFGIHTTGIRIRFWADGLYGLGEFRDYELPDRGDVEAQDNVSLESLPGQTIPIWSLVADLFPIMLATGLMAFLMKSLPKMFPGKLK